MTLNHPAFFLMRHGETNSNKTGIWQCSIDEPLNLAGVNQSLDMSWTIRSIKPDIVISSDLRRAIETATIALGNGHTIILNENLRERRCGEIEGLNSSQIEEKFGFRMDSILSSELDKVPGAEKLVDFEQRISGAIEDIISEYPDKRLLVVTHGGVIRMFYSKFVGQLPNRPVFKNCSILGLRAEAGRWTVNENHNALL